VGRVVVEYLRHARSYYRKADGSPTNEPASILQATRPLIALYRSLPAAEFSPVKLAAVREEMIRLGWIRSNINRQVSRLRQMFKWAAARELIPPTVHAGLTALAGLRAGRSSAAEGTPVKPVDEALVNAVKPYLSAEVRAMIELQRLTGMRPGEVCMLRTADLDMKGKTWVYTPPAHKTAHHGHSRVIYLGPRAQAVLTPFLRTNLEEYVFSPATAEAQRNAEKVGARVSKRPPAHQRRMIHSRRRRRRRAPTDRYTPASYRRAIARACDKAFDLTPELAAAAAEVEKWRHTWAYSHHRSPRLKEYPRELLEKRQAVEAFRAANRWHPHQLRHTAATELRRRFGIEAARVVLGHRSAAITEVYAEIDQGKAAAIMGEVG
jgi:integrase